MGAVSCEPCPAGTTSAGGQVSSCSCTDGTFEYVDLRPNPDPGTYWENNGVKYTCATVADSCEYRQITRLPTDGGGMPWSMLYTALLEDPSVKQFQVNGTSLGGGYAYYSAGGQEYRLKVKTVYNTTTKQCECPAISGVPAQDSKTNLSNTSKTALQQINEAYGENLDTLYGCNYNICGYARVGDIYVGSGVTYDTTNYTLLDTSTESGRQQYAQWTQTLMAISGHSVDASCVTDNTLIQPLPGLVKTRATVLMKYNQVTEGCDCPDDFSDAAGNKYHFLRFSADINAMTCIAEVTNNGRYGCRLYIDPDD